ncbi:MAG: helix-hairpin-helix domain-containing protein [Clostridiales bacterium]|nr:helix-hairpin-helix domain-containing protein [Clostridiales bacterium]
MKNKVSVLLAVVTALFVGFTLGLFVGRNTGSGTVTLAVSPQMQTAPTTAATAAAETVPEETVSFPVNINTADADTLTALPGIGRVLAERIVAYRRQNGSFRAIEEITKVEGIGEKKAEAILELITVGG